MSSSTNKFLGTDTGDVTDGSIAIFGSSIGAANLQGDFANTVKIGTNGVLLAESIVISDITGLQDQLDAGIQNPLTSDLLGGNFNISDIRTLEIDNGSFGITLDYSTGITNQVFDLQTMIDIEDVTQNFLLSTTENQTDISGDLVISGDFQFGGALIGDLTITDINFTTTQTDNLQVEEQDANFSGAMSGLSNSIGIDGLTAPTQVMLMGGVNKATGFIQQFRTDSDGRLRIRLDDLDGSSIDKNAGNASNGTQRVVIASDQSVLGITSGQIDLGDGIISAGTQRVVIASDQSVLGITNPNNFINNQGIIFDDWYLLANVDLSREGYWDVISTFTTTSSGVRGLQLFDNRFGATQSATIRGDFIYPQLVGSNIITLFHYSPWSNGNFVGSGGNLIMKFGFKKIMLTGHNGYSRIVVNTDTGISIEYTDSFSNFSIDSSNFNIDKLDGTGPSGYSFDVMSMQMFYIMENFVISGRYTFGFLFNGTMYDIHVVDNSGANHWFQMLGYNQFFEILVDGSVNQNSGIHIISVESYITIPFTFDVMKTSGYNKSVILGLQNISAAADECIFAIRYSSPNPVNVSSTFLQKITVSSDAGRFELVIYRIRDTITISAGTATIQGDIEITKQPTINGGTPSSSQIIYSSVGVLTQTFNLSGLSWKNIGYNVDGTRILLLVFVKNIASGGGGADIYSTVDWFNI